MVVSQPPGHNQFGPLVAELKIRPGRRVGSKKKRAPPSGALFHGLNLEGSDALGARALGARLDLERDLLATLEAVEVTCGATPVEEEFLTVFGCDKAEATVRDQFLDGACRHFHLLSLSNLGYSTRRGLFDKTRDLR